MLDYMIRIQDATTADALNAIVQEAGKNRAITDRSFERIYTAAIARLHRLRRISGQEQV